MDSKALFIITTGQWKIGDYHTCVLPGYYLLHYYIVIIFKLQNHLLTISHTLTSSLRDHKPYKLPVQTQPATGACKHESDDN